MIEIDRLVARDILHAVQPATPARHRSIPWASSVLLQASGSMLTASGSNLDLQVDATGPLQCDDADLTVAVRRSVLAAAIRTGGPTLRLDVADDRLVVQPDESTTIKLRTTPVDDMALVDDQPDQLGCELAPDDVADIASLADACSTDVARPVLTGVAVDDDGMWAATDSYRLAWHRLPDTAASLGGLLAPGTLWHLVKGWSDPDPVRVSRPDDDIVRVAGTQARGRGGARTVQVVARQRTITFPTVSKLLPHDDSAGLVVTVDAARFAEQLDTIRRVGHAVMSHLRNTPVQLSIDADELRLGFGHVEDCEIDAGVPIKESAGDTAITVAFNPTYLAQAIATVTARGDDPTVTVHLRQEFKPGHLSGSSPVRVLLMPMRTW